MITKRKKKAAVTSSPSYKYWDFYIGMTDRETTAKDIVKDMKNTAWAANGAYLGQYSGVFYRGNGNYEFKWNTEDVDEATFTRNAKAWARGYREPK